FGPKTEVLHDLKLDGDEAPRPEQDLGDFVVCKEIRRLFSMLDAFRNGTIDHVEVRTGLPRRTSIMSSGIVTRWYGRIRARFIDSMPSRRKAGMAEVIVERQASITLE